MDYLEHVSALRLQPLEVSLAIVNQKDVKDTQVQALHEGAKRRIVRVKVHVRIYRRQGGKAREITGRRQAGLGFVP
jgi:hypothetical protein